MSFDFERGSPAILSIDWPTFDEQSNYPDYDATLATKRTSALILFISKRFRRDNQDTGKVLKSRMDQMRKILIVAVVSGMTLTSVPALADPPPWAPAHGKRAKDRYDSRGWYIDPPRLTRADRIWRGDDGKIHCRRENGTTGLVIGAAVGALAGHELAGRGDKTIGTIIGAAGGAVIGRAIDRGELKCR